MSSAQPDRRRSTYFDRRRANATEAAFRVLVESVKDYAIFMLDPGGRVASWNPGAQRIKGYSADQIIGRHFSIFYSPEDIEAGKPDRMLQQATAEERTEDEGWRVRKDGSRFWANVVLTALRDPSGALLGFAKITRDLTERRRTEQAVRESEERFAKILRASPVAICLLTGAAGQFVEANSKFAELLGYREPSAVIGKTAAELGLWSDPGEYERLMRDLWTRRSIREATVDYRTRDGLTRRALAVLELLSIEGRDCVLVLFWRA